MAQETLHQVLVALRDGRVLDMQALPAYIFETARHICARQIRQHQRTDRAHAGLADVSAAKVPQHDPLSALISHERVRAVRAALAELLPDDRELLRLTYGEGRSAERLRNVFRYQPSTCASDGIACKRNWREESS